MSCELLSTAVTLELTCPFNRTRNLAKNAFPVLPTTGLAHLQQIQTQGNPFLKDFPSADNFPKIQRLALSYAYHCCQFLSASESQDFSAETASSESKGVEETIVWLDKEADVRDWGKNNSLWSRNQELWNFSAKLNEYANQLFPRQDGSSKDDQFAGNLAQYAEEYFEDYKSVYSSDYSSFIRHPIQCLPLPSESLFEPLSSKIPLWLFMSNLRSVLCFP